MAVPQGGRGVILDAEIDPDCTGRPEPSDMLPMLGSRRTTL